MPNENLREDLSALTLPPEAPREPAPKWRGIVMAAAVAAVAFGGGYVVWRSLRSGQHVVQLAEASLESRFAADVVLLATGHVEPAARATVSALAPGRVQKLFVHEGQQVQDGDVIAELDTALMESEIVEAKLALKAGHTRLRVAQRALAQAKAKQSKGTPASAEMTPAIANVEVARAELRAGAAKLARTKLALKQSKVLSTLSGRIWKLHADVGGNLNDANLAVADIVDTSTLFVDADVAEAKLGEIKAQMPADITLDAFQDKHFDGVVEAIRPEINRETSTGVARLKFLNPPPEVLPQMGARVAFLKRAVDPALRAQGPRLVVPQNAVVTRAGKTVVFVYANGSVSEVEVTAGAKEGADVEVTSGLSAGMKVVRDPPSGLASGDAVDLQP